jgi:hypothetical protein
VSVEFEWWHGELSEQECGWAKNQSGGLLSLSTRIAKSKKHTGPLAGERVRKRHFFRADKHARKSRHKEDIKASLAAGVGKGDDEVGL